MHTVWDKARQCKLQIGPEITGGFSVGFDPKIPEQTKDALMEFIYWVEDHYELPVTLWVDFKNRHYLLNRNKKRMGYLFYWADFKNYPVFDDPDDIPVVELPVRTERYTLEEILASFVQAITHYFAWLTGERMEGFLPDEGEAEAILQAYLMYRKAKNEIIP